MTVNYFYDHLDRVVKKCYNNDEDTAFLYLYNGLGALASVTDTATQEKISYVYDTVGRPSETRTENGDNIFRVLYGYDEISRPNSLIYKYNGAYTQKYSTSYIADNRITLFKLNNGQSDVFSIAPTFDTLGRQTSRTLKNGSGAQVDKEVYSFLDGAGGDNASTSVISSVGYYGADSTVDETYTYTYDDIGNIKTVSKNGTQIAAYTYNSFNMLTGYTDADGNTYTYGYSSGKNISETGKYLLFYTDDVWLDRVTCITDDASGKVFGITYDGIGNTLSYRDGISFTWKNGRQLATFTQGQTSASYDYNESGIRNKKTVNGVTTTYQLAGSMIVSENRNGNIIQYYYNEAGSVIGLRYNGNDYFFRRTVNGDIIAILNTSGEVVVTYEYDPWGNILSTGGSMAATLGAYNPFRYRGYYYDTESGLYYLQTRYYDAAIGRFINADGFTSTGQGFLGNNMYAYCLNNPMTYKDSFGTDAVVIYDDNFVGHLGFLFQDENDDWFYYWGPMNANDKMVQIFVFLNNDYITNEIVSPFYGDPNSLESISANSGYSGTYSDMLYIEGDFSALSKNISDYGNVNYNLYSENCVQHSLKLLASCDTLYKYAFLDTSQHILPSTAMKDLKARVADIVSRRRTYTVRSLTTFRPAGKGTAIYLR